MQFLLISICSLYYYLMFPDCVARAFWCFKFPTTTYTSLPSSVIPHCLHTTFLPVSAPCHSTCVLNIVLPTVCCNSLPAFLQEMHCSPLPGYLRLFFTTVEVVHIATCLILLHHTHTACLTIILLHTIYLHVECLLVSCHSKYLPGRSGIYICLFL